MAQFIPVVSSMMAAVRYDRERSELTVQFSEDAFFTYSDVPSDIVVDFLFADSIGSAFNSIVKKGGFEFERIPAKDARP